MRLHPTRCRLRRRPLFFDDCPAHQWARSSTNQSLHWIDCPTCPEHTGQSTDWI